LINCRKHFYNDPATLGVKNEIPAKGVYKLSRMGIAVKLKKNAGTEAVLAITSRKKK